MQRRKDDPINFVPVEVGSNYISGLTKREYLAALALQGIVSNGASNAKLATLLAVNLADELIIELNRTSSERGKNDSEDLNNADKYSIDFDGPH